MIGLHVGQLVTVSEGAGFAGGAVVTVLELRPGGRARIAYGRVTDLTVPAGYLEPLHPTAREGDGSTSHQAAAAQTPARLTAAHREVLAVLVDAGRRGLTDFELANLTGRKQTSCGVRRGELVRAGLVEWSEHLRPSDTGARAKVWRATELGAQVWAEQRAASTSSNELPPTGSAP